MRIGLTGASGIFGTAIIYEILNKYDIDVTSINKGFEKKLFSSKLL